MDEFLSPDALYCASPFGGGGASHNNARVLPCAQKLPYRITAPAPKADGGSLSRRPKGLTRTMAHEADRIFGNGGVRNLAAAGHIRCKDRVETTYLFHQDAIAIVTKSSEVEIHWFGSNPSISMRGKGGHNKCVGSTKSQLKAPSCDELLCSTYHSEQKMIALLSTVTAGRRYMLSLVRLPSFRGDAPEVVLQCKLPPCTLSSSSDAREVLQFNASGNRIVLGTTEKCFVADTAFETSRMWTPGSGRGNFKSVALHDKFLFAVRGRTISIYDASSTCDERPIATGRLDPAVEKPDTILVFGGRIWLLCPSYLLCTPKGMLQNLNKLSSLDGGGGSRGGCTFTVDTDHKYCLPLSDDRCTFKLGGDLLIVSSGREIRAFDRRRDASSPFVFSAASSVTSIFADTTKLVCATRHPNGRSGRVEIFHLDTFAGIVLASLVVKKTFQSQHEMHCPQLNGRYISIAYSYDDGERASLANGSCTGRSMASLSATVGGEVQIFDLLRLEGK